MTSDDNTTTTSIVHKATCLYLRMHEPSDDIVKALDVSSASSSSCQQQQAFLRHIVFHPIATAYPPKHSYTRHLVKRFITTVEDELVQQRTRGGNREDDEGEEEMGLDDELVEVYMSMLQEETGKDTAAPSSVASMKPETETDCFFFKTYFLAHPRALPVTIRVAPEFSNVGLAVWPSGIVVCNVVASMIRNDRNDSNDANKKKQWRILELGAGVGFTASALLSHPELEESIDSIVLTDYQPNILENCDRNLDILFERLEAKDKREGAGEASKAKKYNIKARSCLIDWTEVEEDPRCLKTSLGGKGGTAVEEPAFDLIVAADVVYDRCVLKPLAATLRACLDENPQAVCVVVQTCRNPETIREFFDCLEQCGLHQSDSTSSDNSSIQSIFLDVEVQMSDLIKVFRIARR